MVYYKANNNDNNKYKHRKYIYFVWRKYKNNNHM